MLITDRIIRSKCNWSMAVFSHLFSGGELVVGRKMSGDINQVVFLGFFFAPKV